MGIVGDKHIVLYHLLHHRMTAFLNVDHTLFIESGPHILIMLRHIGQGSKDIQSGYGPGCLLNPFYLPGDGIPNLTVQVIFQCKQLILGI